MAAGKRKRCARRGPYRDLLRKAGMTDAQAETFHRNGNGKPDGRPVDFDPDQIRHVPIDECRPSPENERLYRRIDPDDPKIIELASSILTKGFFDPLTLTLDHWILSGHRRHAAAKVAGLETVPVRYKQIWRSETPDDEFLKLLREANRQREKTLDERILENLVDVDPDEAMRAVVDEQVRRSRPKSKMVYVPAAKKKRARITTQTRDFANAIIGILDGPLKDVLPVPERAIHYHLLNLRVRTSRGKSGFVYGNDRHSSGALSRMLTRLRLCGEVPWDSITDETRPVGEWELYDDAAEFLRIKTEELYVGFAQKLMKSQSAYYEIVLEKLTIKGFIDKVAARYTIKTCTLRGNSSIDARHLLAERFKASGKKSLVLFVLSDCDPAGDIICQSTVHSLRDEFGIDEGRVSAIRVAMTHELADKHKVSEALPEKKKLSKKDKTLMEMFRKRHGRDDCYELEAVSPEVLAERLDHEIRANIDIEAYNHEVQSQAAGVAKVRAMRKAALELLRNVAEGKELD